MSADLSQNPRFAELVAESERVSDLPLGALMASGPASDLQHTLAAQLSVFVVSVALAQELLDRGGRPVAVAGHSLGEYSALVAGGWLDTGSALAAVVARARAMDRCCAETDGTMAAVVGLDVLDLETIVASTSTAIVIASRNSAEQAVISGPTEDVQAVGAAARAAGARAVLPLRVAGAFHSELMREAESEYAAVVRDLPLVAGQVPLVSGMTGGLVSDPEEYRGRLAVQITTPVLWREAMSTVRPMATSIVEVGPGQALRSLLRGQTQPKIAGCTSLAECDYALTL